MSEEDDWVDVAHDGVIHKTGLATLYDIEGDEVWIPNSVHEESDDQDNVVLVKSWWAEKEGLA